MSVAAEAPATDKTFSVMRVLVWHNYRPGNFGVTPDPLCPICGKSLGHSVVLTILGDDEEEHEIHANCLPPEGKHVLAE